MHNDRLSSQDVKANIIDFSKRGNGRGFVIDQSDAIAKPVEVPFTMPGDVVRATLFRKRGGIYASKLEEIVEPSPTRVAQRCVHFGVCGGCRWQHIPYEEQLRLKQEIVEHCFANIITPSLKIKPILACDLPWYYRNKMEFSFSNDAAIKNYLGLVIDSSRGKVFNLTECHLTSSWFADALKAVREWWNDSGLTAYRPHANTGSLRTLVLREGQRTGDRLAMLTVSGNPDYAVNQQHLEKFVNCLRQSVSPVSSSSHFSIFLRIQQAIKGMETNFYEMLLYGSDHIREQLKISIDPTEPTKSLMFTISPSAFFQPNTKQAEKLYSTALQMLHVPKNATVYDLYCGTGTLGICVAARAKQVVGIEISPESALDARTNIINNGLTNMTVFTGSVRDVMNKIRQERLFPLPDVVMVDPPRPGLDSESLQHLMDLKPAQILYISCNPSTQAENIASLLRVGYSIEAIQPVDQFPQTVHIENIALLSLKASV
jgi:23S rRNA (uracil1939-C5)-methyltransferase